VVRWMVAVSVIALGLGQAGAQGVMGVWQEPEGARIDVHPCGSDVCLKLIRLSDNPAGTTDGHNPDKSLRARPLVGLEIGEKFHLTDPSHAEDGMLYDPKSGKTYHGSMESVGDELRLRGYVGIKAFGRTETWTRVK
jgi:uncharacterized protein (DUF2147 family)